MPGKRSPRPHALAIWAISQREMGRFAARFGPFRTVKQAVSQRAVRQCVALCGEDAPPQGAQDEKRAANAAPKNLNLGNLSSIPGLTV